MHACANIFEKWTSARALDLLPPPKKKHDFPFLNNIGWVLTPIKINIFKVLQPRKIGKQSPHIIHFCMMYDEENAGGGGYPLKSYPLYDTRHERWKGRGGGFAPRWAYTPNFTVMLDHLPGQDLLLQGAVSVSLKALSPCAVLHDLPSKSGLGLVQ